MGKLFEITPCKSMKDNIENEAKTASSEASVFSLNERMQDLIDLNS